MENTLKLQICKNMHVHREKHGEMYMCYSIDSMTIIKHLYFILM